MKPEICQVCEKEALRGDGILISRRRCPDCNTEWDVYECWKCGAVIDTREAKKCVHCLWYVCPNPSCSAHKGDCGSLLEIANLCNLQL